MSTLNGERYCDTSSQYRQPQESEKGDYDFLVVEDSSNTKKEQKRARWYRKREAYSQGDLERLTIPYGSDYDTFSTRPLIEGRCAYFETRCS